MHARTKCKRPAHEQRFVDENCSPITASSHGKNSARIKLPSRMFFWLVLAACHSRQRRATTISARTGAMLLAPPQRQDDKDLKEDRLSDQEPRSLHRAPSHRQALLSHDNFKRVANVANNTFIVECVSAPRFHAAGGDDQRERKHGATNRRLDRVEPSSTRAARPTRAFRATATATDRIVVVVVRW